MPESPTPQRQVGVYDKRLGRARGSLAKTIGIVVVVLIAIIMALT